MRAIYRDESLIKRMASYIWEEGSGNLETCFESIECLRKIYLNMEKGVELYNHLRYTDCIRNEIMHKAQRAGYFNEEAA